MKPCPSITNLFMTKPSIYKKNRSLSRKISVVSYQKIKVKTTISTVYKKFYYFYFFATPGIFFRLGENFYIDLSRPTFLNINYCIKILAMKTCLFVAAENALKICNTFCFLYTYNHISKYYTYIPAHVEGSCK